MNDELVQKAAQAVRDDTTGPAEISESTLARLAVVPSKKLPVVSNPVWEVSAQYHGRDEVLRIVTSIVMAPTAEAAKAKAARLGSFSESNVRSVYQVDAIARFAQNASELVGSAHHVSGLYTVDKTLLKQARELAVIVCQQLV